MNNAQDFYIYRSGNGSNSTEWRIASAKDCFLAAKGFDGTKAVSWRDGDNWVQIRKGKIDEWGEYAPAE